MIISSWIITNQNDSFVELKLKNLNNFGGITTVFYTKSNKKQNIKNQMKIFRNKRLFTNKMSFSLRKLKD